jgi:hypothetical protein
VLYLIQLIEVVVKESQSPLFTHMVFECLCVLIKKVSFNDLFYLYLTFQAFPFIESTINSHILPVIEQIIDRDLIDFVPYALQIVALMLYQTQGEQKLGRPASNAAQYASFFPHLITGKFWHRPSNAPALLSIFEAFVRTSIDLVMTPENISAVMGLYTKLISERSYDEHGFRLATCLLGHYDVSYSFRIY